MNFCHSHCPINSFILLTKLIKHVSSMTNETKMGHYEEAFYEFKKPSNNLSPPLSHKEETLVTVVIRQS